MDEYKVSKEDVEREFVKKWQKESGKWLDLDILNNAAEMLELRGDELHVDIASGNGAMLAVMKERYSYLTLVGIERYAVLLALAGRNFSNSDIPFQIIDKDGLIGFKYPESDDDCGDKSRVTLVRDNVKELLTLKSLLGNRKIDTASFMLPGITMASVEESLKVDNGSGLKKAEVLRLMSDVRASVCRNVTEIVRPGGRFVVVEKASGEVLSDDASKNIPAGMCGYDRYWWPGNRHELIGLEKDEENVTTGITWVSTLQEKAVPSDESLVFILQSFKRNHRPFVDNPDSDHEQKSRRVVYG